MTKYENEVYGPEKVVYLDDGEFVKCHFDRCLMLFKGEGGFSLDGCTLNDARIGLRGYAEFTMKALSVMRTMPGWQEGIAPLVDEVQRGVYHLPKEESAS